jgi:hypothetical protein
VRRRVRHLTVPVLVAVAAVAGCGDRGPTDRDATEAVFLETCAPGATPLEERVCRCAFDTITEDLSASGLERLDRNLRDDPDTVPPAVSAAVLECAAEPLTPPTPRPTTSTTTSTERSSTTSTTERDP